VFISASKKVKFAQQYFAYLYYEMFIEGYGWRQYNIFPIGDNDYGGRPSFDYSDPGVNFHNPIRNLKLIISDGHGKTARVRRWEDQRMTIEGLFDSYDDPSIRGIAMPIFFHYNGLIGVHWQLRSDTDLSTPETGRYGVRTRITYHAALFTPKLEEVKTETIGVRASTRITGEALPSADPLRLNHPYYQLNRYLVPGTAARYNQSPVGFSYPSVPRGSTIVPETLMVIGWGFHTAVFRQDYTNFDPSVRSQMYFDAPPSPENRVAALPGVDDSLKEYERLIAATELDLDPKLPITQDHPTADRPFFQTIAYFVMDDRNRDQDI
jgi:hypothetical protein